MIEADRVCAGVFPFGRMDHTIALEAAGCAQAWRGENRLLVEKRAVALEVQDAVGSRDFPYGISPPGNDVPQSFDPLTVGAGRLADQDFAFRGQDIATFDETGFFDGVDLFVVLREIRRHRPGLAESRRRTRAHQDCAFGQAQGRVLDEDRVRELLERRQNLDHRPGRPKRGDIVPVVQPEP